MLVLLFAGSGFTLINCTTHGLNALFVLVDTLVTRTPVRMLHFYQCTSLGLIYGLFSSLYWLAGGTNHLGQPYIYKPLDFSRLNMALSTILLSAFVAAPIIHCWIFFLYRFRLFIHRYLRVMEKRNGESVTEKVQWCDKLTLYHSLLGMDFCKTKCKTVFNESAYTRVSFEFYIFDFTVLCLFMEE